MVAIVSGNGAGLNLTNLSPLGPKAAQGQTGEGSYVNIATGNLVLQDRDSLLVGRGQDVGTIRTYNNQGRVTDDNGDGWWLNGYRRITNLVGTVNTAGSVVQRIDADGSALTYNYDTSRNLYVAASGSGKFDTISFSGSNGQWTWVQAATQNKETYADSGGSAWHLVSSQDTNGNTTTYTYNGHLLATIQDANGETTEFSYAGTNLTQERIKKADGSYVSNTYYRYDASNRLNQVKVDLSPDDNSIDDGNVYVTNYSYAYDDNAIPPWRAPAGPGDGSGDPGAVDPNEVPVDDYPDQTLISSVTQSDGSQLAITYITVDGQSRVGSVTDALGRVTQFSYDTANKTTTVTDPLGNQTVYVYDTNNRFISITGPAVNGVSQQVQYQYDTAGNLARKTDAQGNQTSYTYDSNGNVLTQTDSLGNRTENTYNKQNKLTRSAVYRTPANGSQPASAPEITYYAYNTANTTGNLRFAISAQGQVTEYLYDSYGQRTSAITYGSPYIPGTYVEARLVNVTTWSVWTAMQDKAQTSRIDYQYDSRGQLTSATSYASMNADGTGVMDGTESTTKYTYDVNGNLLQKIDPNKNQTSYVYDGLNRVLSSTDALGHTVVNYYDDADHVITHMQANGRVDTNIYDSTGELLSTIQGGQAQTEYRYDALGRLALSIDPTGNKQFYIYDASGNLSAQIDGKGNVTEYAYNALGQRIQSVVHSVALTAAQLAQIASRYDMTPTAMPVVPGAGTGDWSVNANYVEGDRVIYGGKVYEARFSNQGVAPDYIWQAGDQYSKGYWKEVSLKNMSLDWSGPSLQVISNYREDGWYEEGRRVYYKGKVYEARSNTEDVAPDADIPDIANYWKEVPRQEGVTDWSPTNAYYQGDEVQFAGETFALQHGPSYDTSDSTPGTSYDWVRVQTNGVYPQWNVGAAYEEKSIVEYVGRLWQARIFVTGTPGDPNDVTNSWIDIGAAPAATPPIDIHSLLPITGSDQVSYQLYDAAGRLSKTVDAGGDVTEYQYDGVGNLVKTTQYATPVSTTGLGKNSRPQDVVVTANAQDRSVYAYYDNDNRQIGNVDAEGYLTQYKYDAAGRRTEVVRYAAKTTTAPQTNSAFSSLIPTADSGDQHSYAFYDREGRATGTIDAEGYLTEQSYDDNGNLLKSTRYANKVTAPFTSSSPVASLRPAASSEDQVSSNSYDALNRVTISTNAEGSQTQYQYDAAGNLVNVISALGTGDARISNQRYDQLGRLTGTLSGLGSVLLTGNQTPAQVDAIWTQYGTSYSYDDAGRRVSMTDPNGNKTLYYFDQAGNLTHTINALGEVQERQYNALNQLTGTVQYGTRLSSLAGLTGGLVNATLTNALAGIVNAALDSKTAITYNVTGTVASVTDQLGAVTTYSYDAFGEQTSSTSQIDATHTLTQSVQFDHRGEQVSSIVDPVGQNLTTSAQYDAFGRLISSVDANGNIRQQSYDRLGRTILSVDPANAQRSTSYDALGRQLTSTDAAGNVTTYTYNSAQRSLTVQTAEGIQLTTIHNRQGQTQSVTDGNGNVTSYAYDKNGLRLNTATALSASSNQYDHANRLIQTTDANGNKVSYSYDATNRLLTRTVDAAGLALTTSYQYDAKGRQVSVTNPNGVVTQINYDLKGQVTSQVVDSAGLNSITRYSYDVRGKVLNVTSPNGNVTQYVYDTLGRRIEEHTDPSGLNLTRTYSYDKDGNVSSTTDADGNVTHYAYDANDRLMYTVNSLGAVQKNTYDAQGRITNTLAYVTPISLTGLSNSLKPGDVAARVSAAAGQDVSASRVYDKDGRLRYSIDGTGSVTQYTFDNNGNVIDSTSYANRINIVNWTPGTTPPVVADAAHDQRLRTVYDALNRAIYNVSATGAVIALSYDGNGNMVDRVTYAASIPAATAATKAAISAAVAAIADPSRDAHVRRVVDAANRLTWSVDGVGAVTQNVFDKDGNLVKQIQYATAISAAAAPNSVVASSNDRVSLMAYDDADRLVYQVNSLGAVTKQVYDANGSVVQRIAYATAIAVPTVASVAPTVTSLAASVQVDAANDRSTRWTYDAANRNVFAINSQGAVQETRYDGNGNVVASLSYAKAINTQSLPAQASTSAVRALLVADAGNDRLAQYAYDAAGHRVYTIDAMGYVQQQSYDSLGRAISSTQYAQAIATGTANTATAIAAALHADAADQTSQYRYDVAGELIGTTDASGHTDQFSYDGVGNKLSHTDRNGAVTTYDYDAAGHVVRQTAPAVALTTVSTDANGNLVANAIVSAGIVTRMSYDALGNMATLTEADGRPEMRATSYQYDAVGRRVKTIYPTAATYLAASDNVATNGANGAATRVESSVQQYSQVFYDTLGNAVASRDVAGNYSYKAYDKAGNIAYDVNALGYVTGYGRNSYGEMTSTTRYAVAIAAPSGPAAPNAGQVATVLAGNNHSADRIYTSAYDLMGRLVQLTEPQTWVNNGSQGSLAAAVTRYTYNAFGQQVQAATLADAQSNTWATSTSYYDQDGRKTATVNALGYVSTQAYDAEGNVTRIAEYATATSNWTPVSLTLPTGSADDRVTSFAYDRLNRMTSQTLVNIQFSDGTNDAANGTRSRGDATTSYGYDAVGNRTSVTDALGGTTYTYFDAMGRTTATAEVSRNSTLDGSALTPLTEYRRDALGNVSEKIEYANSASNVGATGYTAGASNTNDRITLGRYDSHGNAVQNADANGVNHFASYDAQGHIAKQWQGVTGNDGQTHTQYTVYQYDALGRLTKTLTPGSTMVVNGGTVQSIDQSTAGVVSNETEYNAFGETVRQGLNGGRQIYFDYDNAGQVWRTNSGDGVDKVMLHNLQGVQTAVISSAGAVAGVDLGGNALNNISSAQQAEQLSGMRRTVSQVDLLGRVTTLTMPERNGAKPVIYQSFDRWGNVLSRSNLFGNNSVTTYLYNASNAVIQQKESDGNGAQSADSPTTLIYYDRLGRQIAVRDANGNLNRQVWDTAGNLVQEQHADGGVVKHYLDAFDQQLASDDANGNRTTYVDDHLGHVTQTSSDVVGKYSADVNSNMAGAMQNLVTQASYDQAGRMLWQINPNGEKTSYDYDLRGNLVATHQPLGQVQKTAYDAEGRQIGSLDANGVQATWSYDYFGTLTGHKDLGGAAYTYSYDSARQLIAQQNSRGQNLSFTYDGAGQVVEEHDVANNAFTLTSYNLAGQHIREQSIKADQRYQDNWLAYNAQGNLARVDSPDDSLTVLMEYDKAGNLVHQQETQQAHAAQTVSQQELIDGVTHTLSHTETAQTAHVQNLWSAYDSMQRQTLVEGAANGNAGDLSNITSAQGHIVTYDKAGNRVSDMGWGDQIVAQTNAPGAVSYVEHQGYITQYYQYDKANRLVSTAIGAFDAQWNTLPASYAVVVDQRYYDGAGRLVQSGLGNQAPAAYRQALMQNASFAGSATTTTERYDANGRLLTDHVVDANGSLRYETKYTAYDAVGNVQAYATTDAQGNVTSATVAQAKFETYKQQSVNISFTKAAGGVLNSSSSYGYDSNGLLISITNTDASGTKVRVLFNDLNGNILRSVDNGTVIDRLLVKGQILATWSGGAVTAHAMMASMMSTVSTQSSSSGTTSSTTSTTSSTTSATTSSTSANSTTGNLDESGNTIIGVHPGDTLQSLAQAAYGDSKYWYVIADANGLANNLDLVGHTTLVIPPQGMIGLYQNQGMVPGNPGTSATLGAGATTPNAGPNTTVTPTTTAPTTTTTVQDNSYRMTVTVKATNTSAAPPPPSGIVVSFADLAVKGWSNQTFDSFEKDAHSKGWDGRSSFSYQLPDGSYAQTDPVTGVMVSFTDLLKKGWSGQDWNEVVKAAQDQGWDGRSQYVYEDVEGGHHVTDPVEQSNADWMTEDFMMWNATSGSTGWLTNGSMPLAPYVNAGNVDSTVAGDNSSGNNSGGGNNNPSGDGSGVTSDSQGGYGGRTSTTGSTVVGNIGQDTSIPEIPNNPGGTGDSDNRTTNVNAGANSSLGSTAVDNRSLLSGDKSTYEPGDSHGRDVTKSGDTLGALFYKNYGYAPSHEELIQYANVNNLSDAHDLSTNREIISPDLNTLHQQSIDPGQLQNFNSRDTQFADAQKTKALQDAMAFTMGIAFPSPNGDPNYETALNAKNQSHFGFPYSQSNPITIGIDNSPVLGAGDYLGAFLGGYTAITDNLIEKSGIGSSAKYGVKYGVGSLVSDMPNAVGGTLSLLDTANSYHGGDYEGAFNNGTSGLGAIGGAEAGAAVGALGGPLAPATVPIGTVVGALGGAYGGRKFGEWIQNTAFGWIANSNNSSSGPKK